MLFGPGRDNKLMAEVIPIPEFREREAGTSADTSEAGPAGAGWDPYEVWRTRVLQPRLEEARQPENPEQRPSKRSFLSWLRRNRSTNSN